MLKNIVALVSEAVDEGHNLGISLFMENLEEDLEKSAIFENAGGVTPVMKQMFEEAGIEIDASEETETIEEMDENKIDQLLAMLDDGEVDEKQE